MTISLMLSCRAGNYPDRMCQPMADYFLARGGEVRVNSRLQRIELNGDGSVSAFRLADGTTVQGDLYVSAMPGTAHATAGSARTMSAV